MIYRLQSFLRKTLSYFLFSKIIDFAIYDLPRNEIIWIDAIEDEITLNFRILCWALFTGRRATAARLLQFTHSRQAPALSESLAKLDFSKEIKRQVEWQQLDVFVGTDDQEDDDAHEKRN